MSVKFYTKNLLGLMSFLLPFSYIAVAPAALCTQTMSCEDQGFNKTEAECGDKNMIRCPSNPQAVFCFEPPIEECKIGSIIFSDKSCGSQLVSGKKAIGVIFDTTRHLFLSLEAKQIMWCSKNVDVPGLTNMDVTAKLDMNGKSNTQTIVNYAKSSGIAFPAAQYCKEYKTEGTVAGDWYLPSIGEGVMIMQYRNTVENALKAAGSSLDIRMLWTSTEFNYRFVWLVNNGANIAAYIPSVPFADTFPDEYKKQEDYNARCISTY